MTALQLATDFIAEAEGFRSAPYLDSANVWTIGFGFTVTADGQHVGPHTDPITETDGTTRLSALVARVQAKVVEMVHVPATDAQIAALTSFAYNCGTPALMNSTLLRMFNAGDTKDAAAQFQAWCHAGGVVSPGLLARRRREAAMFLSEPQPARFPDAATANV